MLTFQAYAVETLSLTKSDALARALDRNLGIKIQQAEVEIAEQRVQLSAGDFDPVLSARYETTENEDLDTDSFDAAIGGKLSTGGTYNLGVSSAEDELNPGRYRSFTGLSFRQPLLRNFGLGTNLADLRIARYQFDLSQWEYKQTVLDTLAATLFAFNDLYEAQQSLAIAVRSRDLAQKLVDDNKKRVELGVIAKLDIASAEAQYAFRSERVLQASIQEKRTQNRLKQLIFDEAEDALNTNLETSYYIEDEIGEDFGVYLESILNDSPRFHIAEVALEVARLRMHRDRNGKLPSLDLIAQYGYAGEGGSLGGGLEDSFGGGRESFSIGAAVNYPILNRKARSQGEISNRREQIADIDLRRVRQAIQLEFYTAYEVMKTNLLRVEATRYAKELADKSLVSEEKKLNAGTSSSFIVLRLQNDLAVAEVRELAALTNYNRTVVQFNRLRGVLE